MVSPRFSFLISSGAVGSATGVSGVCRPTPPHSFDNDNRQSHEGDDETTVQEEATTGEATTANPCGGSRPEDRVGERPTKPVQHTNKESTYDETK